MKSNDTDPGVYPLLISCEETPELAEAWRNLFSAAWDAYEIIQQRRREQPRQNGAAPSAEEGGAAS